MIASIDAAQLQSTRSPGHDAASGQGRRGQRGLLRQLLAMQRGAQTPPLQENRTIRFVTPLLRPHLGQCAAGRQISRQQGRRSPWLCRDHAPRHVHHRDPHARQ